MDKLDKAVVDRLAAIEAEPAVTIYLPMHTTASPPHITENQIRWKNLLHKAAAAVRSQYKHGQHAAVADALDKKIDELFDDLGFWESQTPGLLLVATPDMLEMYQLPIDTEEYVAVDHHFHLAPVLGLLQDAHEFYVLTLAQHEPKLYQGTLYGLQPTAIQLPTDLRTALNIDEPNQKSENQGTTTGPSSHGAASQPSQGRGWFNGRGGARNPQEEDRMRFWRYLDKIIYDSADRALPLILAGTESETVEYREISKYPKLLQAIIPGNHTSDELHVLFAAAQQIVRKELIVPEHQAALEEYHRISGANPDRVAQDLKHISEAAAQGRVDKLLARLTRRTADTVRDQEEEVPRLTFPAAEDSKYLNDIALQVFQTSGTIFNLEASEMPNGALMAARLRY